MESVFEFLGNNEKIFTSIGILLTFLISIISLYFSVRNNKAVHYVNSITKSRIEWVQKLRSAVAEFISNTNIYDKVYCKGDYEKTDIHLCECQKLCTEIKLLLNYCDKKDKEIAELVDIILKHHRMYCDAIHECTVNQQGHLAESDKMKEDKKLVEENIQLLSKKIQIYLKSEWNRIKYESQGKVYEKATQEFDYIELENKYNEPEYKNNEWKRWCINTKAYFRRKLDSPQFSLFIFISAIVILILIAVNR